MKNYVRYYRRSVDFERRILIVKHCRKKAHLKNKIFLNFGNDGDFDVTEELLPCLKSSQNSALNKP